MQPHGLEKITIHLILHTVLPALSTSGQAEWVLNISMGSWAANQTSGLPGFSVIIRKSFPGKINPDSI